MDRATTTPPEAADAPRAELAPARDIVACLYKTVKACILYPPTNPLPAEFKSELNAMLAERLSERGALTLEVRRDELLLGGQRVRQDAPGEEGLATALSRDGVVKLSFLPGLRAEELDRFVDVLTRAIKERRDGADLASLLWEAAFRRIQYEASSGLEALNPASAARRRPSGGAGDGRKPEYAAIVAAERARYGGGAAQTARTLSEVGRVASAENKLAELRAEAAAFDPVGATVGILSEILKTEDDADAFRETCDLCDGLYDRLIEQGAFRAARRLHAELTALERAERDRARVQRLAAAVRRPADAMRTDLLFASLDAEAGRDLDGARELLLSLPPEVLPRLVAALGRLERRTARGMVCGVLVERGAGELETIGSAVTDGRWYVVRNVAMILGQIGGAKACPWLAKAVRHADARVRREAIESLAKIAAPESSAALRAVLADGAPDLRLRALRVLSERHDAETAADAARRARESAFARLPAAEQQEWLSALARARGDAALPLFKELIGRWAPLAWGGRRRLRAVAAAALAEGGGPETEAYLQKVAGRRDKALSEAAAKALAALRARRGGKP